MGGKGKLCLKIRPWFPTPGTPLQKRSFCEGAFYLVLFFPSFRVQKRTRGGGGHKRDHPTPLRVFALSEKGSGGCISKVSFSPPFRPVSVMWEKGILEIWQLANTFSPPLLLGLSRQIWQIPHFYPWTDCLPPVDSVVSLKSPPNASCRFTLSYEREKFVVFPHLY